MVIFRLLTSPNFLLILLTKYLPYRMKQPWGAGGEEKSFWFGEIGSSFLWSSFKVINWTDTRTSGDFVEFVPEICSFIRATLHFTWSWRLWDYKSGKTPLAKNVRTCRQLLHDTCPNSVSICLGRIPLLLNRFPQWLQVGQLFGCSALKDNSCSTISLPTPSPNFHAPLTIDAKDLASLISSMFCVNLPVWYI